MGVLSILACTLASLGLAYASNAYTYTYCQSNMNLNQTATSPPTGFTLQQVQVMIRHGDRTPISLIPSPLANPGPWNCGLNDLSTPSTQITTDPVNDPLLYRRLYLPNREVLPGSCMIGQLTSIGYQQHTTLGAAYRNLYVSHYDLIPDVLNMSNIWVRSVDEPRIQQSAQTFLSNLYPATSRKQDIVMPIYTMDEDMDNMSPNTVLCPRISALTNARFNTTGWKVHEQDMQPVLAKISQALNLNSTITNPYYPFDIFNSRVCHGMGLPAGIDMQTLSMVSDFATFEMWYLYNTTELISLSIGDFMRELLARIETFNSGATPEKFVLYAGHDTTIAPLMMALGLVGPEDSANWLWPPYASHMALELWSDASNNQYVRIHYNSVVQVVPGCQEMCPLAQFVAIASNVIPNNFAQVCQNMKP
eukprot:TRINITY_DN3047_c0_g1_i1.p1 TRINITY_DN3047_c0_g1~~TRINITY_DN3047_c0_g1_i1.p1  ORF type:complete len:420 (-),score=107.39 TRINITY_DN3047_c0_g1_i1:166-1425(-)